jgi:hypothetical protein
LIVAVGLFAGHGALMPRNEFLVGVDAAQLQN